MAKQFKLDGAQIAPEMGDAGEFFGDLIDHLYDELIERGIAEDKVADVLLQVIVRLSRTFGGESFYVSKDPAIFDTHMRMYSDAKWMPYYDVDVKYKKSRGYTYKIVEQINQRRQHRQQLRLDV